MHCKPTTRVLTLFGALLALTLVAPGAGAAEVSSRAQGQSLITAQPDNPGAYMTYAAFLADNGDPTEATRVLEKGRDRAEPSVDLNVALGNLYRDQKQWAKAETAAAAALVLRPDHTGALVLMGEIYFGRGRNSAGLESFRAAMASDPAATRPKVRLLGGLVEDGQLEAAEEQCLRFVSANTEDPDMWMALGRIFERQGKHREAFTTYGQVLSLDPDRARAYARQGKLFCEFSQFEAAEISCRRALDLDQDDALAHAYLGIALSHLGDSDAARLHAEVAEKAGMNMTVVWRKLDK
ncbi:hypothetical protein DRQ50_07290 [bacterium]|nr:MAG: hypothetical protein DRQ50_07290 [bacterium]